MDSKVLESGKRICELLGDDEACNGQARAAKHLVEKLENKDLTVSVIGQFKRGKSTLANYMLGEEVLPVGIVPITSAATWVKYGKKASEVHFLNGAVEKVDRKDLHEYISEQENSGNEKGVESVVIHTPSKFLKHNLTFVDTPGVGSFHKNNTETAYHYMKESDAVIFLLSVDSPINQIEIDFLYNTREYAGKFYFAVNKVDVVEESDLTAYMDYCKKLLCELMETENIQMFPVSGKTGYGVEALETAILRDSKKEVRQIMERSTAKKLREIIRSANQQLDFYWKAMNMEYKELDIRFDAISKVLDDIREKAKSCNIGFEIRLNEFKLLLSDQVKELFGMEYHYDIDLMGESKFTMDKEDFLKATDNLCTDLKDTLNSILMYREENAYVVVRRISRINLLIRRLRVQDGKLADILEGEGESL